MSSRFGSDGYTNSQRKRMVQSLRSAVEQGEKEVEALQSRLEELGAPRLTDEEAEAMVGPAAPQGVRLPQPKGHWVNGKLVIPKYAS